MQKKKKKEAENVDAAKGRMQMVTKITKFACPFYLDFYYDLSLVFASISHFNCKLKGN